MAFNDCHLDGQPIPGIQSPLSGLQLFTEPILRDRHGFIWKYRDLLSLQRPIIKILLRTIMTHQPGKGLHRLLRILIMNQYRVSYLTLDVQDDIIVDLWIDLQQTCHKLKPQRTLASVRVSHMDFGPLMDGCLP